MFGKHLWAISFSTFLLASCGGDDNDDPSPSPTPAANQNPSVNASNGTVLEGEFFEITADARDTDGSIATYSWTQQSGVPLTLEGSETATVSFTAPAITEDSEAVLRITVTDDDGASSSSDVTVTINANLINLTISGLVTASPLIEDGVDTPAPIVSPTVSIDVGDQSFSTTADENGNYSVTISVDDSLANAFVRASAAGVGDQAFIRFTSLMDEVATLAELAGEDGILERDEFYSVNITTVTSAKAALFENADDDGSITSKAEYLHASRRYEDLQLLDLAQAQKIIISYAEIDGSLALPEGYADTYAFISDLSRAVEYIADAEASFSDTLAEAQEDLFEDVQSVPRTDEFPMASFMDNYYARTGSTRFSINANGTGRFRGGAVIGSDFTWRDDGAYFTFDYEEDVLVQEGIDFDEMTFELIDFRVTRQSTQVRFLVRSDIMDHVEIRHFETKEFPNSPERENELRQSAFDVALYREAALLDPADFFTAQANYSMVRDAATNPIAGSESGSFISGFYDFSLSVDSQSGTGAARFLSVNIDGTKTTTEENLSYESLDNHFIVYRADESLIFDYVLLDIENSAAITNVLVTDENNRDRSGQGSIFADTASWNAGSVAGIYILEQEPGDTFMSWFEINASGTAMRIFANDQNLDGNYDDNEIGIEPGYWQINDAGNLEIRRYRRSIEFGSPSPCIADSYSPPVLAECTLFSEYEIDLQIIEDDAHNIAQTLLIFSTYITPHSQITGDVHLVETASSLNTRWMKVDERPLPLPESDLIVE